MTKLKETKEEQLFREMLGKRIRSLRTSRGLDEKELSELAGISPDQLQALEQGEQEARVSTLLKIAKSLGVTPAELVMITEKPDKP